MDNDAVTDYKVDCYEENPGDPGQWCKGAPGATTSYSRTVQVDYMWFILIWISSLLLLNHVVA